jgi:hypothetical protein
MKKEDFSHLMKDWTAITHITVCPNKILLRKNRFGIDFIEEHYNKDLVR